MRIPNSDFLSLTLENPETFVPTSFPISGAMVYIEETGILRLEPDSKSEVSLVLSVGIHGNETGPIELVNELLKAVLIGELELNIRLLIIIGNPVAANQGQRFCKVNLNRLFCSNWQHYDGYEARRAQRLEQAVSDFFANTLDSASHLRLHYDLHTAIRGSVYEKFAVYPYLEHPQYSAEQLGFLASCGIEAVLLSHQPTTTFSYYSYAEHGAYSFTIELGKVYSFGENDLSRFADLKKALIYLISQRKLLASDIESMCLFKVLDALEKDGEDYQLVFPESVKNFTAFEKGVILSHSSESEYRVKENGDAIVFPNEKVPLGQRTGLVVRPINLSDLSLK